MAAFQAGAGAANHANVALAAIATLNLFGFYRIFAFWAARGPTGLGAFDAFGGAPARGCAGLLTGEIGCGQGDDDDEQRQ